VEVQLHSLLTSALDADCYLHASTVLLLGYNTGGPQRQSRNYVKDKNLWLCQELNPGSLTHSHVSDEPILATDTRQTIRNVSDKWQRGENFTQIPDHTLRHEDIFQMPPSSGDKQSLLGLLTP
jgi:hypothetical protein